MLDAHRLKIFCTVAEEGSFTAAARRLHFTQSAVSQQVAILERELGIALVERLSRGVQLTTAGCLLAERARGLLHDLCCIEQELHRYADRPAKVRLGVFSTAGAHLVPMVVQEYRQRYGDTQLVLEATQREGLAKQLADGAVDVGLSWDYDFAPRPMATLRSIHLLDDPLCLLLPQDHRLAGERGPVRLVDVAADPWIARTHRPPYADAVNVMCHIAGFEPDVVFHTADYQSMQGLVAAGVGVAVAPHLSVTAQRPDLVVRPFHEPAFTRRIDALVLPQSMRDPHVLQLLDVLRDVSGQVAGAVGRFAPADVERIRAA